MLGKVKAWLELIPLIIATIKAIEQALPETGLGTVKLTALRAALAAGYDTIASVLGPFEEVWPKIEGIVGKIVEAFNKVAFFNKGTEK